jgi:hypothetical protein
VVTSNTHNDSLTLRARIVSTCYFVPKMLSMKELVLNLGCLHPVALVRSDDVGFYPSTQRHSRRLIYYLYIT